MCRCPRRHSHGVRHASVGPTCPIRALRHVCGRVLGHGEYIRGSAHSAKPSRHTAEACLVRCTQSWVAAASHVPRTCRARTSAPEDRSMPRPDVPLALGLPWRTDKRPHTLGRCVRVLEHGLSGRTSCAAMLTRARSRNSHTVDVCLGCAPHLGIDNCCM